jgi:hypothetical protein
MRDGARLGDGEDEGPSLGCILGSPLGLLEGLKLGLTVGLVEGCLLGKTVGTLLGVRDGARLGDPDWKPPKQKQDLIQFVPTSNDGTFLYSL